MYFPGSIFFLCFVLVLLFLLHLSFGNHDNQVKFDKCKDLSVISFYPSKSLNQYSSMN
jgi:hypothetical protein